MKKFVLIIIILMMFVAPLSVSAANACSRGSEGREAFGGATDRVSQFPKCITSIYTWSLGVAGVLALLMATAGGFTYMTAAGNAEKTQKGTEMIWGAVIGLALLFGAYLLLNTINPNLVNFNLDGGVCMKDGKQENYKAKGPCESAGGKWYQVGSLIPPATPPSPRN